jgi:hypothetical protein
LSRECRQHEGAFGPLFLLERSMALDKARELGLEQAFELSPVTDFSKVGW